MKVRSSCRFNIVIKNYWIQLLVGCMLLFVFSENAQAQMCKQFGGSLDCSKPRILYRNYLEAKSYATAQSAASGLAQFVKQNYNAQCNGSVFYGYATYPNGTPYPRTDLSVLDDPLTDLNFAGVVISSVSDSGELEVCTSSSWYVLKVAVCPIGAGNVTDNGYYMCAYSNSSRLPTYSGKELPDVSLTGDMNEEGCLYGCNPVNLSNGSKVEYEEDYKNNGVFPIVWSRRYNNQNMGWFFSYSQKLTFEKK